MAKITELVKANSVRVNLGNFAHWDSFASAKAELGPKDDSAVVAQTLSARINEILLNDLRDHHKARGKTMTDKQLCRMFGLTPEF